MPQLPLTKLAETSLEYEYPPDYNKLGAWFLGPKTENHGVLEDQFRNIVPYFKHGCETYFPSDPVRIFL